MSLKDRIRQCIYGRVVNSKSIKLCYLRLAVFLSNRGIRPPLALSFANSTKRWEEHGITKSTTKPENYIEEDNSLLELFREVLPCLNNNAAILEVGCNCGRSLNYLHKKGFTNLTGVEIGAKAIETMKNIFAETYNKSRIIEGNAAPLLKNFPDNEFDLVFCHSVLVNIHPAYNYIFKEIARVSKKFILILENEGSLFLFPRNFERMFGKYGYKMIVKKVFRSACRALAAPFVENDLYSNNTIRLFTKDVSR